MNQNLSLLIELQKLDLEIDRDEKERKKILAETDRYTKEIEKLEKDLLEKDGQLKKTKREKRIEEGKIEEIDLLIAKHEEEKYKVKSQDEFAALEKEITLAKDQKEKVENLLLEIMEKEEELTNSIPLLREKTESDKKDGEIKRKKLAMDLDNLTRAREKLEGERKNLTSNLDPVFLEQFEHLKRTRDGLAVVPTKDGACGGCHVKLSSSLMGRVRKGQGVVYCENCNRILYYISDSK
jgi:hypothetical protein